MSWSADNGSRRTHRVQRQRLGFMSTIRRLRRAVGAGFVGTAAMATTTLIEKQLRRHPKPIDYDDSTILVDLAERILPINVSSPIDSILNQAMRFGYGSAAGVLRHLLEGRVRRPATVFFAIAWTGEAVALRALGVAPPPWRWKRDVLVTSLLQHVVYAAATDAAYRTVRNPR